MSPENGLSIEMVGAWSGTTKKEKMTGEFGGVVLEYMGLIEKD